MALLDNKVQYPATRPERFPRTGDITKYRQNFDEIFRKKKNTHKGETNVQSTSDSRDPGRDA